MNDLINNKRLLLKVFFTNYIDLLAFGIFIPILPFLFSTEETGVFNAIYPDKATLITIYGLLIGSFSIGSVIGSPLLGAFSDKYGRKPMLMLAYSVNTVGFLLLAAGTFYVSLFLIFLGRLIPGLMGNTQITIQSLIADVSTEETKTKNFGIPGIAFGLGFVTGVLIVVGLSKLEGFDYTHAFLIAAVINSLNLLFLWFKVPETNQNRIERRIRPWTGFSNIQYAFTHRSFQVIFLVIFSITIGFVFFMQFFQYYLIDKFGFNDTEVGAIFIYLGLLIAIAQGIFLPKIAKHYSPERILLVSPILFAVCFLLVLLPTTVVGLCLVMPLMVLCQSVTFPSTLAIISNLADDDFQGQIMGINQSVQALANAVPPILLGFAVGVNVGFPMYFGAVCCLIGWLFFLRYYKNRERVN